jgi:hypothetical protein
VDEGSGKFPVHAAFVWEGRGCIPSLRRTVIRQTYGRFQALWSKLMMHWQFIGNHTDRNEVLHNTTFHIPVVLKNQSLGFLNFK